MSFLPTKRDDVANLVVPLEIALRVDALDQVEAAHFELVGSRNGALECRARSINQI
jgi:hypothetical protein